MSRRSRTSRRIRDLLSRLFQAKPDASSADQPDLHALEPRVLYSAAPMVDLAEGVEIAQADVENEPQLEVFEEAALDWESESLLAEQPAAEFESASGIIFVDSSVEDYESLVQDLAADSNSPLDIVLLDSNWDGVEQITETLANYGELTAIHIVSHGTEGNVQLGNIFLNQQSLNAHAANVESWSHSLADGADILFYGCDLAADSTGKEFVDSISNLTGADVAASDDPTGHQTLGGDWDLEYQTGEIETEVAFSDQLQGEWVSLLADFNETAWSGSNTFVDGAISFNLSLTGGGTIDWSYDGTTDTLTISDNDGTSLATNLTITDNNGGLIIDSVIFDAEIGSIDSDADIGTLITEQSIDNITVGGGTGNIAAWLIPSDMDSFDVTVNANVSTLAVGNNVSASDITINGNLSTFNVSNQYIDSTLNVTGDLGSVNVASYLGTVNITADQVSGAFVMAGDFSYFGIYPTPTQVVFDGSIINSPPTITSGISTSVVENQTAVMTVTATDPDNDPINYSLTGGADQARFAINPTTGQLTFITPPDFESPADLDLDNVYEVEVTADDGNGATDVQTINVSVTDGNDDPTITSDGGGTSANINVPENTTAITTVTATDPDLPVDTLTFAITGGADAGDFSVDFNSGVLTFNSPKNFESPTDADSDGVYEVEVTVNDGNGGSDVQTIHVTVIDVNEDPTITSDGGGTTANINVIEDTTAVTTVTATDPDMPADSLTFSITGGADAGDFSVDFNSGVLIFNSPKNFESPTDSDSDGVYQVEVTVSDGNGGIDVQTIDVTVTNANEDPTITSDGGGTNTNINVAENTTAVTTVTATDPDLFDSLTYAITGGSDASDFSVDPNSGVLTFDSPKNFESPSDADGDGVYEVEVTVSDGNGGTDVQTINVTVTDSNESPIATDDPKDFVTAINNENPVGYWRLGESAGATAVDETGNNAATFNGVSLSQTGGIMGDSDTAVSFDGSDDFMTIAHDPAYLLDEGTVQLWFNPASIGSDQGLFSKDSSGLDTGGHLTISLLSSGQVQVRLQSTSQSMYVTSTNAVSAGQWHHVAFSFGSQGMSLYVDGNLADTNSYSGGLATTSGGVGNFEPIVVGASTMTSGDSSVTPLTDFYGGLIDEVALFDSQLDGQAIQNLFASGVQDYAVDENSVLNVSAAQGVLVNDLDPESDPLTVTELNGNSADLGVPTLLASGAQVTLQADGSFVYDTNGQFDFIGVGQTTTDTFDYTIDDGNGNTDTATATITITGANDAPIISTNNLIVAENQTAAGTVAVTDVDIPADTLNWSLTGSGADDSLFSINPATGALIFITPPSFESPADADGDNVYEVDVQVFDGTVATTRTINIIVSDVNEDPTITSDGGGTTANINVVENTTAVTTVTATDPDLPANTLTFAITGGSDAADFSVDLNSGVLTFNSSKNFESPTDFDGDGVYEVEVTVSDGNGGSDVQSINVSVTDVNDDPTISSDGGGATANINVAENTTAVTTVTASDPDLPADTLTFAVTGGADGSEFSVDPNTGVLTFTSPRNFESPTDVDGDGVYEVEITVNDGNGGTDVQTINVTVTNANEDPTITSDGAGTVANINVAENTTAVTTVSAIDPDLPADTLTFAITGGTDAGDFSIDPNSGVLTFDFPKNFESPTDTDGDGVYQVEVTVSDGNGGTDVQTINVNVTDVADDPIITSDGGGAIANINVAENTTAVTTVTATDPDFPADILTFAISGGEDAADFTIDSNTGVLTFNSPKNFEAPTDSDGNSVYEVEVTVSDNSGGTDVQNINVNVTDVNEDPTITSDGGGTTANINVAENTAAVTTVTSTDPDLPADTLTFAITGGTDGGDFSIDPNSGVLTFDSPKNFETPTDSDGDGVYQVEVTVSDGNGASDVQTINVSVTDVNDDPTITSDGGSSTANLNVVENTTAVTTVTATDPDLPVDTLTFAITGGADVGDFSVDPNSGALIFNSAKNFEAPTDFDGDGVYEVEVTVDDGNGGTDVQTINVTVTDINENPVVATNNSLIVSEGSLGNVINQAALDEGDPDDSGAGLTYTITANVSNGMLRLNGSALGLNDTFNQADIDSGRLTYDHDGSETSSDQFGFSLADGGEDGSVPETGTFNISVNLQNDEQSLDVNLPATVSEGGSVTITNTLLSTSDDDHAANQLVYTLNTVPSNGILMLSGIPLGSSDTFTQDDVDNDLLSYQHGGGELPNDSFDFTVNDGVGSSTSSTFDFTVIPVNDEQSLDVNSPLSLDEGSSGLITSSLLSTSDADNTPDEIVYSITSGPANGQLELVGNPGIAITSFTQQDVDNNLVVFVHDGNESISDSFDFDVDDAQGLVSSSTFTIFANPINDSPVIFTNTGATAVEGSSTVIDASTLSVFDPDDSGLGLIYTVNQPPANGQLELVGNPGVAISSFTQDDLDNNRLVYVHDGTETLTDSFDFSVADGGEDGSVNDVGTFNLVILPSNDAPTINDQGFTADENVGNGTFIGTVVASDPDAGDSLTFTIVGGSGSSAFQIDSSTGDITVADSSQLDFETSPTLTLTVETRDTSGVTDTGTITISLNDVNDPPVVLTNAGATTVEGQFTVIASSALSVLDRDHAPSSVRFDVTVLPANGYLALLSDTTTPIIAFTQADINSGQLVYIHDGSETLTDSFEFFASDTLFESSGLETFNLTITPSNDAPVAFGESFGVNEDTNLVQNVLNNDFDAENQTLSATLVSGPANAKSFVLNSDGSFSYLGLDNFSGSDSFTYIANDGSADSNTVTVNISINPVNDVPTTRADQFSVLQSDLLIPFSGVLQNDFDVEGSPLSAILVNAPANGTIIFNADGTFIYQSDFDFTGIDSFTYMANDGTGNSVTTTVQIEVVGVGFAPTFGSEGSGGSVDNINPPNNQKENQQEENKTSYMQLSAPVVHKANTSPDDFSSQLDRESAFSLGEFKTESVELFAKANQGTAEELLSWVAANQTQAEEIAIDGQLADELIKKSVTFVYNQEVLWEQFDQLSEKGSPLGLDLNLNITIASSSVLVAAGFILWTLRGGMLMASMISSLPTWKFIDPLSVLESESAAATADVNDDAAEKIFAQADTQTR